MQGIKAPSRARYILVHVYNVPTAAINIPMPLPPDHSAAQVDGPVRVVAREHHRADPGPCAGLQQQLHQSVPVRLLVGELPQVLPQGMTTHPAVVHGMPGRVCRRCQVEFTNRCKVLSL